MIKPLPGYVLIEPIEEEDMSGGLYKPETSKDKPSKGHIKAIGEIDTALTATDQSKNLYAIEDVITIGDIVIYKKWTNQEVESDGKKYLLVEFKDLLAVEENE